MKSNFLVITILSLVLGIAVIGCNKDTQGTTTPKITEDSVEATSTTATFRWTVEWPGKIISVVEVSEHEDMSGAIRFGSEEELNKKTFLVTATGLKPATKYYYQYLVWNHNYVDNEFVMETKWFTTDKDLPEVKTLEVIDITRTSAVGQGVILNSGGLEITECGICWSTSHNPTINDDHATSAVDTSTFSVSILDLTPNETYYVRAYAQNDMGIAYGDPEVWFTTGDAVVPTVTTAQVTDISWRTAKSGGEVTDDGDAMVTERGICWSESNEPTVDDHHISNGSGIGSFDAEITNLAPGTTYHVRAYAKNRAGFGYGDDITFNTPEAVSPTTTTADPTEISRTTATCGGEVTSDGGSDVTERGVCWRRNSTPTINDNHLADTDNGLGSFSIPVTGLMPNTSYYICSYAKNSVGISYGTPKYFTTLPLTKPVLTTTSATNITQTSASSGGNITDDGGAAVTERGICWGREHYPTLENNAGHIESGIGTGTYAISMTGLNPNTTYYVRAYAINSVGTSYGNEVNFTTEQTPSYTISVSANPDYAGTVQGGGTFQQGQSARVTATANLGYIFVNWTENGNVVSNDASYTFTVNGNRTLVANFESNAPIGAIDGLFSVSPTQQVYFSKGILQYQASTSTWRFAEEQYGFAGYDNANISPTYDGWIDIYGWGTSGYNGKYPYMTSTSVYDYGDGENDITGTNYDWGVYNSISNGGNTPNQWRTPTGDEWTYVLYTRGTASGIRFAKACVNNVNGVILFPDNWNSNYYTINNPNNGNVSFTVNYITATDWSNMEQHGAVFLPAAGTRFGTSYGDMGAGGGYWSSTHESYDNAFAIGFDDGGLSYFPCSRDRARSVRLIRNVQ